MSGFVIAIRRDFNHPEEIHSQAPSENSAISRADRLYSQMLLDAVAVIEVDSKNGFITTPYRRERRCKHPNVQFTLTNTGVCPVCEGCRTVMTVNETEEADEARGQDRKSVV